MKQILSIGASLIFTLLMATCLQAATFNLPGDAGTGPFSNCSANGNVVTCTSDVNLNQGDEVALDNPNDHVQLNIASNLNIPEGVNINPGGSNQSLSIDASSLNFNGQASVRANVSANDVNLNNNSTLMGNLSLVALNLNSGTVIGNVVTFGNLNNNGTIEGNAFVGGQVNNNSGALFNGNITADGNVNASGDSTITGNINSKSTVNANGATISGYVNAQNINGSNNIQGNTCDQNQNIGPCASSEPEVCSSRIGQGSINELHGPTGNNWFIEVKILNESIQRSEYEQWTVQVCSSEISPCKSFPLFDSQVHHVSFPWIVIPRGMIGDRDYIDFGQGGGNGMEVRLDDSNGRAIDYVSVAGYSQALSQSCDYLYDSESPSSAQGSQTLLRNPDGTGDWTFSGPGGSQQPTEGDSNLDEDENDPYPRLNINDVTAQAGSSAEFKLRLENTDGDLLSPDEPVTINYRTVDGDGNTGAVAPDDYEAKTGQVVILPTDDPPIATVEIEVKSAARDNHFFYLLIESAYEGSDGPVVLRNHFGTAVISAAPPIDPLAYINLEYSITALTCEPTLVTVKACTEEGCEGGDQFSDPVALDLTSSNAEWIGNSEITFDGQTDRQLSSTGAGTATIDATSISPTPEGTPQVRCNGSSANGACEIEFVSAGLLLTDEDGNRLDLTDTTAGTEQAGFYLSAVRDDGSQEGACEAAIESTSQPVNFSAAISELDFLPATEGVLVNTTEIATELNSTSATPTNLSLAFDDNGRTTTSLGITYNDVGKVTLHADTTVTVESTTNTDTLTLINGGPFVVRPASLHLTNIVCEAQNDGDCLPGAEAGDTIINPQANNHEGNPFAYAGAGFTATLEARNSEGQPTRNFSAVSDLFNVYWDDSAVLLPVGGAGTLLNTQGDSFTESDHWEEAAPGVIRMSSNAPRLRFDEVGILSARARIENFLGGPNLTTSVDLPVGRFIPAEFEVSWEQDPEFEPGEPGAAPSTYTYQGQSFKWLVKPVLRITAVNIHGATTQNYGEDFYKLDAAPPVSVEGSAAINLSRTSGPGGLLTASPTPNATTRGSDELDGVSYLELDSDTDWIIEKVTVLSPDQAPGNAIITLDFAASVFTDSDDVAYPDNAGTPQGISQTLTQNYLHWGRLRLLPAQGPEDRPLIMPMQVEFWDGVQFKVMELENGLAPPGTDFTQLGGFTTSPSLATILSDGFTLGQGELRLADPNGPETTGRAQVEGTHVPPFLFYDWPHTPEGDHFSPPRATASFGTYEGRPPVLFILPQGR